MRKPLLRVLGWVALAALLAVSTGGGCDWFDDPFAANLLPKRAEIEECPSSEEVAAGDDVVIRWKAGTDFDGQIVAYEWAVDDSAGRTPLTSKVLRDVAAGAHEFTVAAVDDDGGVGPPDTCRFVASEPGGLVGRVVLCELITGPGCPHCKDAREGLEIMLDECGRDSLAVVAYYTQHHPLSTEEVLETIEAYFGTPSPVGLPIVFVDHAYDEPLIGATTPEAAADRYRERIDERRALGSPLTMRITGGLSRGDVAVTVRVEDPVTGGPNVLRIMLVEDNIWMFNENHMFVVRGILEDEALTVAAVGDSAVAQRSFTIEGGWNTDNMDVIAFVQNDVTKEILQSGRLNDR